MSRLVPYPLLAAALYTMWLLLNGFTPGHAVLGLVVALGATLAMAALQPAKPRVRSWAAVVRLVAIVLVDITRSNLAVARIVLRGHDRRTTAGFVQIPLTLRDRTGLAVLACVVTATPGTAWIAHDTRSGVLLLHVLDLVDEQDWIRLITGRYERLLKEIFE